jgi:hypothetical protein
LQNTPGVDILAAATLLGAVFTNFSAESIAQLPDGQQHALSQALFSITVRQLKAVSLRELACDALLAVLPAT